MHNAGIPKSITIRNVPDDVTEELAARASQSGQSLQAYLRAELIAAARRPDLDAILRRARQRVERTGSSLSRDTILGHLDEDRR
jgi:plasmid stability protein